MHDLTAPLQLLQTQDQLRQRRIVDGAQGTHMQVDGQTYLSFCNNDYLGLANDPAIVAAAHAGLDQFGVGAAASALISGHSRAHEALEQALATFTQLPAALYFGNGYMANLGIIPALLGSGDAVFSDRLNHACLIDAARLSRAEFKIYPHNDIARLEQLLKKSQAPRKLVATDAVFSMDGDLAALPQLLALCEHYDAWLLVDDAHGFGVLGANGRGSLAHFNLQSPRLIYMGTLGKAAGVYGAFVAGSTELIAWLLQSARTYLFSTAPPPALAAALLTSLQLIAAGDWRRTRIAALRRQLHAAISDLPWQLLASESAIQALIIGDNRSAVELMQALHARGIWVPAIRPPTVAAGTARLRISLSALHTETDIIRLASALHALAPALAPPDFALEL